MKHLYDLLSYLLQVETKAFQYSCAYALALSQQPQQQVFGADEVVIEAACFVNGQLYHLFGAVGQTNFAGYRAISTPDNLLDCLAHLFKVYIKAFECFRGNALAFAYQAEQEVFRANIVVLEALRLFLGKMHDPPGSFGEALEFVAIVPLAA
jgi:hypothetical protein